MGAKKHAAHGSTWIASQTAVAVSGEWRRKWLGPELLFCCLRAPPFILLSCVMGGVVEVSVCCNACRPCLGPYTWGGQCMLFSTPPSEVARLHPLVRTPWIGWKREEEQEPTVSCWVAFAAWTPSWSRWYTLSLPSPNCGWRVWSGDATLDLSLRRSVAAVP